MADRRGPTPEQLALLRKLAAREAARRHREQHSAQPVDDGEEQRRQQEQEAPHGDSDKGRDDTSASTLAHMPRKDVPDLSLLLQDASLLDSSTLETLLRDERRRNDVEQARLNKQLHALSMQSTVLDGALSSTDADAARRKKKKTELDRIEYEIRVMDQGLGTLDDPQSDTLLALLTRASIASAVEQYEECLHALRMQLGQEQSLYQDDAELLSNLRQVQAGLHRKKEVVERRAEENISAKALTKKLQSRLDAAEADLSRFLQSLIRISDNIFSGESNVQRAQLRHLIDTLINKAWDTPINPYVDVSLDYDASIVAFVLRANIAAEHPRDARQIRLVDFARSARP